MSKQTPVAQNAPLHPDTVTGCALMLVSALTFMGNGGESPPLPSSSTRGGAGHGTEAHV